MTPFLSNMNISDIHTHNKSATNAIINLDENISIFEDKFYSTGIHPWDSESYTEQQLSNLHLIANNKQILAIGECGLDALKGDNIENQIKLLRTHINLSELHQKPLILHIVKCYPQIIALKNEIKPTQPWIIHGFRGKPQLANELLNHGFYLSLGEKHNPSSVQIIPSDKLLVETDESPTPISQIIKNIADTKEIPVQNLEQTIRKNVQNLFKTKIDCRHDNQSS